jgi:two-component system cell cycle sensor histidine kinase/response regulator CckA
MEVLGRLAGVVAHYFNNMLMVIGGCSELLERSLPLETPARVYLDQIHRTSQKAAAITKQLRPSAASRSWNSARWISTKR